MRRRRFIALCFLGLCLIGLFYYGTREHQTIDGRIERIDIPQLYIVSIDEQEMVHVHIVLIDANTRVTGEIISVQELKSGQTVQVKLVANTNINRADTIHVSTE